MLLTTCCSQSIIYSQANDEIQTHIHYTQNKLDYATRITWFFFVLSQHLATASVETTWVKNK